MDFICIYVLSQKNNMCFIVKTKMSAKMVLFKRLFQLLENIKNYSQKVHVATELKREKEQEKAK